MREPQGRGRRARSRQGQGKEGPRADRSRLGLGQRWWRPRKLAGRGGERGEPEAPGPRMDPFNLADRDRPGASMVADILEVSEEEGE